MKHIFTLLPFLLSGILVFSQTNSQINTGSGNSQNNNAQLSWSLGNLVVNSSNDSHFDYTLMNQHDFATDKTEINAPILLKVFPNPSADHINIKLHNDWLPSKLKLIGLSGKTHFSGTQNNSLKKIDLQKLPKGYYFLVVTPSNGERPKSVKILKSK